MNHHVRMTQEEFDALQKRARHTHGIPEPDPPQEIALIHANVDARGAKLALDLSAPPRNKYGARSTWYGGRKYASALEARAARRLDLQVRTGEIVSWRPQVLLRIVWPGTETVVMRTKVDFELTHVDGRVTYLEVKGYRVRDWALRHRILLAAGYPIEVWTKG